MALDPVGVSMIEPLSLIIMALAITRLSQLFKDEYGLFGIFERLRDAVGVDEDMEGGRVGDMAQPNQIAGVLSCIWCVSLWLAIGVVIAFYLFPVIVFWGCLPFALSELVILLDKRI